MRLKGWVPMTVRYRLMELRGRSLYSGYADAHQCIFIHIPKTAGTSVARALFGTGSRHIPCTEYERANPKKFVRYFKFAFVRNPWDRLFSAYQFLKNGGMNEADATWAQTHLINCPSFVQFVHEWINQERIMNWVHFRPQSVFITDSNGKMAMDFLGRMEKIDADFEFVCRKINISASLQTLNKVDKEHYTKAYSKEMIDIVSKAYESDIDLLNYSFING